MAILRNRAQCSNCGEIVESKHRHDLVQCPCGGLFVDGGKDYLRRGWSGGDRSEAFVELSEFDSPAEEA